MNKKRLIPAGIAIAAALALVGAWWLFFRADDAGQVSEEGPPPATVTAQPVETRPFVDAIEALGTTRANEAIEVTSEVASVVTRIHFREGALVQTGEVLVSLDSTETQANLAAAQAALVDSRSQYQRSRQLFENNLVSASDLQRLEAQMNANAAQVEAARARLDYHTIRAPFTGRVGLRRVSLGSLVQPGTVITTLDDIDPIKLDFSVPEIFIGAISAEQRIVTRSEAYPGREFTGTVQSLATRVDPISRSLTVRASLPNPEGLLKPGMFLTVRLIRETAPVVLIPEQAVVPELEKQFVFVVNDEKAHKREVTTGRRAPGVVEITGGLEPGETIIVDGAHKVTDQMPVTVVEQ